MCRSPRSPTWRTREQAVVCSTLDFSRRRESISLNNEGNGKDWRFGNVRFSVNWYGDSDDRQLQDHHRRRRYGYGCSRAVPHFHHLQNGSTVLKCRWTTSAKPLAVLRRADRARGPRRTDRGGLSQNIRLNGLATAQRGSRPCGCITRHESVLGARLRHAAKLSRHKSAIQLVHSGGVFH